jgi:hypothetical protein
MVQRHGRMRCSVFSALLASLRVVSCVNNAREEPKASTPTSDEHVPASGASSKVELIATSPCATATGTSARMDAGCRLRQTALADLDHDGVRDCIQWSRCGPDDPSALADGGFAYPRDVLEASRSGGAQPGVLYTNEQLAAAERFE